MRIVFLLNDHDLEPTQTTTLLIEAAAARGHEVFATSVTDLALQNDDHIAARARRIPAGGAGSGAMVSARLQSYDLVPIEVDEVDLLWIRTNPARDARRFAHDVALGLARLAKSRGVLVLNDPEGLARADSKLYLALVPPAYRPPTLVSHRIADLETFIRGLDGPAVAKPLRGTHGHNVFVIRPDRYDNLRQILEVIVRDGYAMVQGFVPEATAGDVRLVLVEGEPLEVDGRIAIVARVPAATDFRSNIHAGGHPAEVEPTAEMLDAARAIGPRLRGDGLFLAGLDLIGGKVIEINVFSTGGLYDAGRFADRDFVAAVVERVEARVACR